VLTKVAFSPYRKDMALRG